MKMYFVLDDENVLFQLYFPEIVLVIVVRFRQLLRYQLVSSVRLDFVEKLESFFASFGDEYETLNVART